MEKIRYYNELNINEKINIKSRYSKSDIRFKEVSTSNTRGSTILPRHIQPFSNSLEFLQMPLSCRFKRKF